MLRYRLRNLSADRERAREERKQGGGRGPVQAAGSWTGPFTSRLSLENAGSAVSSGAAQSDDGSSTS